MNGLSQVLDQIVTNNYLIQSSGVRFGSESSAGDESCGRQLAVDDTFNADKALPLRALPVNARPIPYHNLNNHSINTSFADSLFGATDLFADHCLTAASDDFFGASVDHQLAQHWNQFNNNSLLLNATDLDQCLTDFDHNFAPNIDTNCVANADSVQKPIPKRSSTPSSAVNKTNGAKKSVTRKDSSLTSARPPKPVSAYALFFRDAQSLIKSSNPTASFGEISKVVASNWEALNKSQKSVYKQRADCEKKNYLKTLASSRAQQIAGQLAESTAARLNSLVSTTTTAEPPQRSMATSMTAPQPSDADFAANRLTNDTNPSQNEATNSFESTQQQMSDQNKATNELFGNNSNANQEFVDNSGQQLQQNMVSTTEESTAAVPKQHCIRTGCPNDAIDSTEWDSEYCSSDCCVKHCGDVFQAWVQRQQFSQQTN